jgi:NAD(P)-dependent dehydrogenase (short-subunit alcohol dehydrogenase family)
METQSRNIIITGANSGIGKAAAIKLATLGNRVILACRSEVRGKVALEEVKNKSGNDKLDLFVVDMSSQLSVRKFADSFTSKFDRVDVLIHNAANFDLAIKKPVLTEDGVETIFATNHLGPFLLTNLLMPLMKRGAPSRVITVASKGLMMYPGLTIEFDNFNGERKFNPQHAYYHSKLAQIMFTYELARRIDSAEVTANCVRVTNVALPDEKIAHLPVWQQKIYKAKRKFSITAEKQADIYVYLSTNPEVEGISGAYWDENNERVKSNKSSYNKQTWLKLWEESERLTGVTNQL